MTEMVDGKAVSGRFDRAHLCYSICDLSSSCSLDDCCCLSIQERLFIRHAWLMQVTGLAGHTFRVVLVCCGVSEI